MKSVMRGDLCDRFWVATIGLMLQKKGRQFTFPLDLVARSNN